MTPAEAEAMKVTVPMPDLNAVVQFAINGDRHLVGDRLVCSPIEVVREGTKPDDPVTYLRVEVIDGVPECVEFRTRRDGAGRGVRPKDLDVDLNTWVERIIGVASFHRTKVVDEEGQTVNAWGLGTLPQQVREGERTASRARRGRRVLGDQQKVQVADIYNARENGGIEAIQLAFGVSRSTAIRHINAARDAGLINKRKDS